MEAPLGRDDARGPAEPALAPAARELDGTLVRLGARVREEGPPRLARRARHVALLVGGRAEQARERSRKLAAVLDVKVVSHLPEPLGLPLEGVHEPGVAVPQAHHTYAAQKVQVVSALRVREHAARASHELHGQPGVAVHEVALVPCDEVRVCVKLVHAMPPWGCGSRWISRSRCPRR